MLEEHKEILDKISDYLFEKETITGKEFMKMFREMRGIPESEEKSEGQGQRTEIFAEKTEDFLTVLTEMTEAQKTENIEKEVENPEGLVDDYFEED